MKITYDIIKKNIEVYNEAKKIFPAISQYEDCKIDYKAIESLGLGKFADFYRFLERASDFDFEPIMSINNFRTLKPILVEHTKSERFKKYINNRTKNKFDLIFSDSDLFDRLLNGPWKNRPKMRRNGQMGYGTRKNERVEALKDAIVPIINYLIINEVDINDDIINQYMISDSIKWYTDRILNYDNVPKREIELTNKLLETFLDVVDRERIDFRKLNMNYIISAISNKIKNAMVIKDGTILKCIKTLNDKWNGVLLLEEGKTYEVFGTYDRNGFLTVLVQNEQGGSKTYHEYSYFEDMSIRRDDLLSMLLD